MESNVQRTKLYIIPTYRCNQSCSYCYTNSFKEKFPHDMELETFKELVRTYKEQGGVRVIIAGGEPSIWAHIDKAIEFCRELDIKVNVFTNAIRTIQTTPDYVFINADRYFDQKLRFNFICSLNFYKQRGVKINLRYNLSLNDTKDKFLEIAKLAQTYSASLHFAPIKPFKIERIMGQKIMEFVYAIESVGLTCRSNNPLPLCLFNRAERKYLQRNTNMYSYCGCGSLMVVNPDGQTIQPCVGLFMPKGMAELEEKFANCEIIYRADLFKVRRQVDDHCLECRNYETKECQCGCLALRPWF